MKYYNLLTEEQKQKFINKIKLNGNTLSDFDYEMEEIEVYGFKIVIGRDIFLIIKENRIIYIYYDNSVKRILASKNAKYKLIYFEIYSYDEDENYEEILFDCNDEDFLTFDYINDINYGSVTTNG